MCCRKELVCWRRVRRLWPSSPPVPGFWTVRDKVGSFKWRKASSPYTCNGNNNTRPSALHDYCFWLSSGSALGKMGNRRGCDCQQNRTEGLTKLSLWAKFKIDTDELQKHFVGANKTNKQTKNPETNNQTIQDPTLVMKGPCDLSSLGGFEKVLLRWPKWPWVLDHPVSLPSAEISRALLFLKSTLLALHLTAKAHVGTLREERLVGSCKHHIWSLQQLFHSVMFHLSGVNFCCFQKSFA